MACRRVDALSLIHPLPRGGIMFNAGKISLKKREYTGGSMRNTEMSGRLGPCHVANIREWRRYGRGRKIRDANLAMSSFVFLAPSVQAITAMSRPTPSGHGSRQIGQDFRRPGSPPENHHE